MVSIFNHKTKGFIFSSFFLILIIFLSGCKSGTKTAQESQGESYKPPVRSVDDLMVVDCLLPGKMKKLGRMKVILTPRRPVKATAIDCELRGGEYVADDPSSYSSSLNRIWLPSAQAGDEKAMTYAGEIYLRGVDGPPQYERAAYWFQQAADKGYPRALLSLGYLYEKGLGVPHDSAKALDLYRRATGFDESITIITQQQQQEWEELKKVNKQYEEELKNLRHEIERIKNEKQQLLQGLKTKDHERQEAEKERSSLQKNLSQLLSTKEARHNKDIKALKQKIARQDARIKNMARESKNLQKKITHLSQNVQIKEEQIKTKETERTKEVVKLQPLTIKVSNLRLRRLRDNTEIAIVPSQLKQIVVKGKIIPSKNVKSFQVNEKPETVQQNGEFQVNLDLANDNTDVSILVVDKTGKQDKLDFTVKKREKEKTPSINFGTYYALVIGNNSYSNYLDLESAAHDAQTVAEVLRSKYNFKTEVLVNASKKAIISKLFHYTPSQKSKKKLKTTDNLLIYYAGHGELNEKDRQNAYWLPVDADPENNKTKINTRVITSMIEIIEAQKVIVIADTCFSGLLTQSAVPRPGKGTSQDEWLKKIAKYHSRVVISSGGLKPILDKGSGDHSIFADALINILDKNDEVVEARQVHEEIYNNVIRVSTRIGLQQEPEFGVIINAGHKSGDFLFVPRSSQYAESMIPGESLSVVRKSN